jgi:hypothetical protein
VFFFATLNITYGPLAEGHQVPLCAGSGISPAQIAYPEAEHQAGNITTCPRQDSSELASQPRLES